MKYLAIDTSGKNLTIVINDGKTELEFFDADCGVQHSVSVMCEVENLVEKLNFDFNSVDFFVSVVGPGSFTGIRIGVATIKAFCLAHNKKALSITSFDTLAYNISSGKRLAIIDAKHNCYYICGYDGDRVVIPPTYATYQEVLNLSKEYTFCSFENINAFENVKVVSVVEGLKKAIEAKKDNLICAEEIEPLYIRKSQAEEGR